MQVKISKLARALFLIIYIGLLAGKFSLTRISPAFDFLGSAGIVAYWNLLFIIPCVFAIFGNSKKSAIQTTFSLSVYILSLTLLLLYLLLSISWSKTSESVFFNGADLAYQVAYLVVILCTLFGLLRRFPAMRFQIVYWLFWTAIIYAIGGIVGYDGQERMSAFAGGANVFVRIISVGILTSMYFWFKGGGNKYILLIPVLVLIALASGSRGGISAFLTASFYFSLFILKKSNASRKIVAIVSLIFVAILVGVLIGTTNTLSDYIYARFFVQTFQQGYLSTRDQLFILAWELFLDNPMVGVGFGGFEYYAPPNLPYPHNLVLHVASEGGVIGLSFLTFILIAFLSSIYKFYGRITAYGHLMLSLSLYYLIVSMFSGSIYDTRFLWLFLLLYFIDVCENSLNSQAIKYPVRIEEEFRPIVSS